MNAVVWFLALFMILSGFDHNDNFEIKYAEYKNNGQTMFWYTELPSHFNKLRDYFMKLEKKSILLHNFVAVMTTAYDYTIPAQEILWDICCKMYCLVSYGLRECFDNYYRFFEEYGIETPIKLADYFVNAFAFTFEFINRLMFKICLGFHTCGDLIVVIFPSMLNEKPGGSKGFFKNMKGFIFDSKSRILLICHELDLSESDGVVWFSSIFMLYVLYKILENNVNAMNTKHRILFKKLHSDCKRKIKNLKILWNEEDGPLTSSLVNADSSTAAALATRN